MSAKPNLRLVSSFRETRFPYKYTLTLRSDLEDDICNDAGFVNAVRAYLSSKMNDLDIADYKLFMQDDTMDILFTNSADFEDFRTDYEDRANRPISLKLKFPGKHHAFQLENIKREFESLSWQFQLESEIRFEIDEPGGCLAMTTLSRDAFLTFFQEYEHTRGRLPLKQIIDPENMMPLLR